jgi:hypothetical protein
MIKDRVPSIGSIIQENPLFDFFVLNSSPTIPSFGNFFVISFLKNDSISLSMFVTGSKPFFFFDLFFNLNLPFNFLKYNLLIFFGNEFKNL